MKQGFRFPKEHKDNTNWHPVLRNLVSEGHKPSLKIIVQLFCGIRKRKICLLMSYVSGNVLYHLAHDVSSNPHNNPVRKILLEMGKNHL